MFVGPASHYVNTTNISIMFATLTSALGGICCCATRSSNQRDMSDSFNEELGRRIRDARKGKLTQATLGNRVGLSRTAITNIECGRQRLLVDQLVAIADAIGVAVGDLVPARPRRIRTASAEGAMHSMPTVSRWLDVVRRKASRGGA